MKEQLREIMSILNELSNDINISKGIRQRASEVILVLNNDAELAVKCDQAIQLLTFNEGPNIDSFTKTRIWSLLSLLESIS